jgi:MYXO-CTERM domain-containing protein
MSVKVDAALGVFAVGLALLMIGVAKEFNVALLVIGGLLMLGAVAATARRRRTGPDPDVTLRPGGKDRPWRRNR